MRILFLVLGFLFSNAALAKDLAPSEVFERLKTLVGSWEGKTAAGRSLKVSYRLTANKTVLVETWTLGPSRESLTLYHMDHKNLLATHYCPIGNQPRLQLKPSASTNAFIFEFVSATNLPDAQVAHQHQFDIQMLGADTFSRSETYVEKGQPDTEKVTYSREK